MKAKTEREIVQDTLVQYLENNTNKFDSPSGVSAKMGVLKSGGKVRLVNFGVARYLDATIYIYSPKDISVRCSGPLSYKIGGNYKSVNDILKALELF